MAKRKDQEEYPAEPEQPKGAYPGPTDYQIRGTVDREVLRDCKVCWEPADDVPFALRDSHQCEIASGIVTHGKFSLVVRVQPGAYWLWFPEELRLDRDLLVLDPNQFPVELAAHEKIVNLVLIKYLLALSVVVGRVMAETIGLSGVEVTAVFKDKQCCLTSKTAETDDQGCYQIDDIFPGPAEISVPDKVVVGDQVYEHGPGQPAKLPLSTFAGQVKSAPLISLVPEARGIVWTVTARGGQAVPNVLVEVLDDRGNSVASGVTNEQGRVVFPLEKAGHYSVQVHGDRRFVRAPSKEEVWIT